VRRSRPSSDRGWPVGRSHVGLAPGSGQRNSACRAGGRRHALSEEIMPASPRIVKTTRPTSSFAAPTTSKSAGQRRANNLQVMTRRSVGYPGVALAPVAQGIEHRSPKAGVGSSNLPGRTTRSRWGLARRVLDALRFGPARLRSSSTVDADGATVRRRSWGVSLSEALPRPKSCPSQHRQTPSAGCLSARAIRGTSAARSASETGARERRMSLSVMAQRRRTHLSVAEV
jgi:hypothetical protein